MDTINSTTAQHTVMNGVDVTALEQTLQAVAQQPDLALFRFRNANRWIGGSQNRSTIKGFYGAGKEDDTRTEAYEL